ncbi:hypothetical protein [Saccharothrix sp. NRRL B-16348]|uniref:hypothetical protein n=1 Tax=Saccharothrix sp. NRRL B-16348 TaxID=1415542 RepID=UPI001E42E900|nr:hypothetical protein [Saccharothrix sp. NRRL B-16348]
MGEEQVAAQGVQGLALVELAGDAAAVGLVGEVAQPGEAGVVQGGVEVGGPALRGVGADAEQWQRPSR